MHYQQVRTEVFDAIQAVFRSYDLLLTPTVAIPPVDNADDRDTIGPIEVNGISVNPLIGWCPTFLINFSGHPAALIPAGLTEQDLPVGMQIVGRRLDDASVLAASAAFERLRPWYDTYEHCAARPL
jgi:amidase/aspartyl-tRNA(Asn)/glutamyl-tRNA(Gln) amidotransferase subunit A